MGKKMELLTLKGLHLVDELPSNFDDMLAALVKDCVTRPALKNARKLKLEIELRPRINADGSCDDVIVDHRLSSKAPSRPVRTYLMRATNNGGLKFAPDSPLDPDQNTLYDEDDKD